MIVAQLGARMHYAVPRIYSEAGMLEHFYTDICAVQGWPRVLRWLPDRLRPAPLQRLMDRVPRNIPRDRLTSFPSFGLRFALERWRHGSISEQTATYLSGGRTFSQLVADQGFHSAQGVYAFKLAGLEIFQRARSQGLRTVLEMPSAHRKVMHKLRREEYERHGDWIEAPENDRFLEDEINREQTEWEAADVILCPSRFVLESVREGNGPVEKCEIVPYGVDRDFDAKSKSPSHHRNLRVLTVGAISLVKGSPYVLKAARSCREGFEFRMVGSIKVSDAAREALNRYVDLTGPVPRSAIHEHYQWADVFLLPSICEGSATVIYEALASGLPVVCTPNTGSIVRDHEEGFVVPNRDSEAIVEALNRLRSDRRLLQEMSSAAVKRYHNHGSMDAYADRLTRVTRKHLPNR